MSATLDIDRARICVETDQLLAGLYWQPKDWTWRWHFCRDGKCDIAWLIDAGPIAVTWFRRAAPQDGGTGEERRRG